MGIYWSIFHSEHSLQKLPPPPPPPLPHKSLRDCCVTFKPKSYLNILFSMQARTTIQRQYIYFASETEGIEVHDL